MELLGKVDSGDGEMRRRVLMCSNVEGGQGTHGGRERRGFFNV